MKNSVWSSLLLGEKCVRLWLIGVGAHHSWDSSRLTDTHFLLEELCKAPILWSFHCPSSWERLNFDSPWQAVLSSIVIPFSSAGANNTGNVLQIARWVYALRIYVLHSGSVGSKYLIPKLEDEFCVNSNVELPMLHISAAFLCLMWQVAHHLDTYLQPWIARLFILSFKGNTCFKEIAG